MSWRRCPRADDAIDVSSAKESFAPGLRSPSPRQNSEPILRRLHLKKRTRSRYSATPARDRDLIDYISEAKAGGGGWR